MDDQKKRVVLSGIRATGKMHLGNYIGAIKQFVELSQDPEKECYYFIANLHTLTTRTDPLAMQRDMRNIVLDFIAAGIDLENSTIFAQSSVPETTELTWLLACLTSVAELERMPHFKEKKEKKEELGEAVNAGLLAYPVLMAADILGPKANLVPVGEDQHPHLELTRQIAKRFNNRYGKTFPIPEVMRGESIRVPGLDGTGKMGKSDSNTIDLTDPPDIIEQKIKVAVTDPARKRRWDPGSPQKCNIFSLHVLLSSPDELSEVAEGCRTAKISCIECKRNLSDNVISLLKPFQERRQELIVQRENIVDEILHEGGKKARQRIAATVNEAKEKVGVPSY